MDTLKKPANSLADRLTIEPNTPLWKRLPTRIDGRAVSDFMMFLPGLNKRPKQQIHRCMTSISGVLCRYEDTVVFADLNLKINLLWISLKSEPGMCLEVAAAIHDAVPEAKLISQRFDR